MKWYEFVDDETKVFVILTNDDDEIIDRREILGYRYDVSINELSVIVRLDDGD